MEMFTCSNPKKLTGEEGMISTTESDRFSLGQDHRKAIFGTFVSLPRNAGRAAGRLLPNLSVG